jgi:hypothetical protein
MDSLRGNSVNRFMALLFGCWLALPVAAESGEPLWVVRGADGGPEVQLYFFWTPTCQHCTEAHPHIGEIPKARPWVRVHALELTGSPDNARLYQAMARHLGEQARSVPALLFCGEMHVGWDSDETTGARIRERLDSCRAAALQGRPLTGAEAGATDRIELPLFGRVDPHAVSLPLLTLVLAGLDAFNPCAFFVLLFLLSMLVHQKNRARMLLIGGVFVAVSGLMYFVFMAAWLNLFQLFGHIAGVTIAAGLLALLIGAVNVKDFFAFQHGVSLSIPASKKGDIYRRARTILSADSLPTMLAATVFLAVAVNLYELLCTVGFPMVYTRVLTLAELSTASRYLYLAAYNLVYIVPLALIVGLFAFTLGARKLTEREGRLLKLLSGIMMLGLGIALLVAPEWVGQPGVAIGLMMIAVALTWIGARMTRHAEGR